MHSILPWWRRLALCAALVALMTMVGGGVSTPFAQTSAPPPNALRPEIATPLQAAEELIRASKFDEALAMVRQADAVADRTPNENLAIDRCAESPLPARATSDGHPVLRGGHCRRAPRPADRTRIIEVLAQLYFQAKDYPKAGTWALRFLRKAGRTRRCAGC